MISKVTTDWLTHVTVYFKDGGSVTFTMEQWPKIKETLYEEFNTHIVGV